jgi:hypothetical protein
MQHLIDKNSKRPYISFRSIHVINESLRRHISWRTNANIFKLALTMRCKSKISYFRLTIRHQNISSLNISMYYIHWLQVKQSLKYIFKYNIRPIDIFLITKMPFSKFFCKISAFTILIDRITVVISSKVLIACYYIGMPKPFYDV